MSEIVCYDCKYFKMVEEGPQCEAYGWLDTSIILYQDKDYKTCHDVILDSLQKKIDYYEGLKKYVNNYEYGYYEPRL